MVALPFEVFVLFLGIALFIGLIGIIMGIRKIDGAPFITVFAGVLIFTQIVITSNIIFPSSPQQELNFDIQEIYHVHDWDFEFAVRNGGIVAIGQEVTSGSDLISESFFDRLDCIQIPLYKSGNPTGNATIAVFDQSVNVVYPFGTIDVSTLTTTFDWYEFCAPAPEHHFIEVNDVIGIEYTGGNSTNFIIIKTESGNPISGSLVNTSGGSTWNDSADRDMTMVLYNRAQTIEIVPYEYPFNSNDTWAYMITLSALFIFIGVILQWRK